MQGQPLYNAIFGQAAVVERVVSDDWSTAGAQTLEMEVEDEAVATAQPCQPYSASTSRLNTRVQMSWLQYCRCAGS